MHGWILLFCAGWMASGWSKPHWYLTHLVFVGSRTLPCLSSLLLSSRLPSSPTPLAHCFQVSTLSHFPSGNVIGQTIFDARTTARTIHTLPAASGTTLFSVVGRRRRQRQAQAGSLATPRSDPHAHTSSSRAHPSPPCRH